MKKWGNEEHVSELLANLYSLLLDHAGRAKAVKAQPEIWALAAFLEIVCILDDDGLKLPPGAIYPKTFEFEDGLIWTHTGRHARGVTGPEDPLATCEFLGDAYMKIGYGGRALIRGGSQHFAGGTIDNLYKAGAERNIATFHQNVVKSDFSNETVPMAIDSCLATIMAREACLEKGRVAMTDLLKSEQKIEVDLTGLQS